MCLVFYVRWQEHFPDPFTLLLHHYAAGCEIAWNKGSDSNLENLDAADGQPRFDLGAGEAIGHGVIMRVDLDMVVDAGAVQAPLAIFVRLDRQRLQRPAVDLFEQLAAGDAETAEGRSSLRLFSISPIAALSSARL